MKNIYFFVLACFLVLSVSAQKKNTIKNNNVKSVTVLQQDIEKANGPQVKESYTLYDDQGNTLEEIEYNKTGMVSSHMKYVYNSDNNKTKEIEIGANGKVIKTTEYKYSGTLKTEKDVYDANGKLKSKKNYQYEYLK
jgi:hypothetical protein